MDAANSNMLMDAADSVLTNAEAMQKGASIGKKAMDHFTRYSASVHSFSVYTYMDADFEKVKQLSEFQQAIDAYTEHYVALRNLIDVKVNQKEAMADFQHLQQALAELKKGIANF
ncbi:hypothetical protein [Kurthia sibirica]|uniref:LXG domain-containing protein n=1 Tax=Kurthia sibirica TaxID=202750 RepID=A0A2U3AKL3_9BACL|nr:hypothetical protein [Kurthia sibirica]PWI25077.1 hypothetical protein DEX24_10050 [Kurthia sibirica]GEK35704.1 hypothetical protein KSI01_32370 [Kurthia sibirica]